MKRTRTRLIFALLLATIAGVLLLPLEGAWLALAKLVLRAKFSDVRQITPGELDRWLSDTNRPAPLLLDVRQPAEFAVSRIAGARRIDPQANVATELFPALPADQPVIVYCAVGYRSCEMARRLQASGITNVFNLEGAIFAWVSEGRPIENDDGATKRVHPFNWIGRRLLSPEHRADVSSLQH